MASKARNLADLLDSSGDVQASSLDSQPQLGRRNLIINGAMQVAQRGTSQSATAGSGFFTVDRWRAGNQTNATYSYSQDSDVPSGFPKSWKITAETATGTLGTSQYHENRYAFEGQDVQSLGYGTAGAKTATLSFYVKSNKAGNYAFYMLNHSNNRLFSTGYTIDAADTWQRIVITIPPDNSYGMPTDNSRTLSGYWPIAHASNYDSGTTTESWAGVVAGNLMAGAKNGPIIGESVGDYWQITGVQLELGSVATPFEHRSYGEELALCQRYFQRRYDGSYVGSSAHNRYLTTTLNPEMRANPSANVTGGVVSGNDTGTVILVETPSKVILFQASATYSVGARYELDAEL